MRIKKTIVIVMVFIVGILINSEISKRGYDSLKVASEESKVSVEGTKSGLYKYKGEGIKGEDIWEEYGKKNGLSNLEDNKIQYAKNGFVYKYKEGVLGRVYIIDYKTSKVKEEEGIEDIVKREATYLYKEGLTLMTGVLTFTVLYLFLLVMNKLTIRYVYIKVSKYRMLRGYKGIEGEEGEEDYEVYKEGVKGYIKGIEREEDRDINYIIIIGIISIVNGSLSLTVVEDGITTMLKYSYVTLVVTSGLWYGLKRYSKGKKE